MSYSQRLIKQFASLKLAVVIIVSLMVLISWGTIVESKYNAEAARLRCAPCGTHLFSEIASARLRSVNAFLLPKSEFNPQLHVQCQHAVLPVVDDLPHYKGFPASIGGAEEFVTW